MTVIVELYVVLRERCPDDLVTLVAPLDVALSESTVLQPDLLVARRVDFTERDLPVAPLLAVEVVSPSTKHVDVMMKRSRYEAAGCPAYWVVDPDVPALTAWELRTGAYVEVAHVAGDETFRAEQPFPVEINPAALISE